MLTFTRKNGQSVVIQVAGHAPLTVTFLGSRPGKCQLAFEGPHDYHILREELALNDSMDADLRCSTPDERCAATTSRLQTVCVS